jgi:acid phosphatase type 7
MSWLNYQELKLHARWSLSTIVCLSAVSCGGGSASTTVSITPKTTTVIAVGDIAQCSGLPASQSAAAQTAALTQALVDQTKVTSIITLGDNVYDRGLASEFQTCYEPTWGRFKSLTWATPGNHDYGVTDALDYFGYFGQSAGIDQSGYYSKSVNGWLIVSLNSNIDATASSAQYKWLSDQLNANQEACVMAVWHHPIFSSSTRGGTSKMRMLFDLLVSKKADLVLQGHEHQFERFKPTLGDGTMDLADGVTSMVVGTGGAALYNFVPATHPASEVRIKEFGVLQLDLSATSAIWKFVNINQKVVDTGTLVCKAKR